MYFQIENTPEHIRRARRTEVVSRDSPKEECPRLILAPFSRPPQVIFDNVLIGTTCERHLEVYNPTKQVQQITLGKSLPIGLAIQLPAEWLELEPETCYCVTLVWTPTQPSAMRETIRFTNENRGRYDVIVVLKSVMNIKAKGIQNKALKISPGKIRKKLGKKSPVAAYKKKSEIIYNTTHIKKTYNVIQSQQKISSVPNKENVSRNDFSIDTSLYKCPFDSSSTTFNFDTSEVFSNMRKPDVVQQTYDKTYADANRYNMPQNVLKPSNRQLCDISATELFDNLTFTPLKTAPPKTEKLDKGPKIILSMNSESDLDDSLDMNDGGNKENHTQSYISITSTQPPNKWLTLNQHTQLDRHINMETPKILVKKHPNTSSPKELNSPNFSINTDFSRISDLSFFPQRFSTERKCFPKINNETQDLLEEPVKLSSDTYTKDSPNTPIEPNFNQNTYDMRPPHFFLKEQSKMCRQSLFREYQFHKETFDPKNFLSPFEHNIWQNELRVDSRSPPRSITPPLQSIPEESVQFSDTQILDNTGKHRNTFTINRTFDKTSDHFTSANVINRQSWSKKAIRAEPDLWKIPITHVKKTIKSKQSLKQKDSVCGKISNTTFDSSKSSIQNMTVNQIGNVYSQSSTVDPFVSSTYFYDEEAVEKFETEFKRWLNCILTPPADLDSNIEQKIDVGKAWIENRNKEVPVAPTKEQVSSAYHNSHRLESLRRSARSLLMSTEIVQVFQKLTLQIEKKLIAIRTDRNLHLDVGLQKIIMELLLSYNPLWLRIGLEAIYGLVLPLKSNSDIEGLTIFIIQRMFKNPFLKNKHSKSNAPNMLLPAYMEAIKRFTLKKFFMLVYFLDQAKQRKLISHDPCLFCRNAVCKESREIIIRFTRELIAGIGDITKHLRPLGYVVSHKQTYIDEYKYAVHNLALDIRDGVRLVKVMEIILIKDGLLNQLRTPAISRLQKIHNVQVALNALRDANFVIHGDITATDIADGHREKTLSLLWQIIHVFRAPLFEKAANVIQTWWRKKYEVIVKKKKEVEKLLQEQNNAASLIQCWWRRIQYNRLVEWKMQQITTATIVVQKYCRMWICRTRLRKLKTSVLRVEEWYKSIKMIQEAKYITKRLRSCIKIQRAFRAYMCGKHQRQEYSKLKTAVILIQRRYRLTKEFKRVQNDYIKLKNAVIFVQRRFRANKNRDVAARRIQNWYLAIRKRNICRQDFLTLKHSVTILQSLVRMLTIRKKYIALRNATICIQIHYRAYKLAFIERQRYVQTRLSIIKLQSYIRSYIAQKRFWTLRTAAIKIQAAYRLKKKRELIQQRRTMAATCIQKYVRCYIVRSRFLQYVQKVVCVQKIWRGFIERKRFCKLRNAALTIQDAYRLKKKKELVQHRRTEAAICIQKYIKRFIVRTWYLQYIQKVICVQKICRTFIARRRFCKLRSAVITIQTAYRLKRKREITHQHKVEAAICIQKYIKRFIARSRYLKYVENVIYVQKTWRSFIARKQFCKLRSAAITIQNAYRLKKLREQRKIAAVTCIQKYARRYIVRSQYLQYLQRVTYVQKTWRSIITRKRFCQIRSAAIVIQTAYRHKKRRELIQQRRTVAATCIQKYVRRYIVRSQYVQYVRKIIIIQKICRGFMARRQFQKMVAAVNKMKKELLQQCRTAAATCIQKYVRRYIVQTRYRQYLQKVIFVQNICKAFIARKRFCKLRAAAVTIQVAYRMKKKKQLLQNRTAAAICIQKYARRYLARSRYIEYVRKVIYVQKNWRTKIARKRFCQLRSAAITVQTAYRLKKKYEMQQRRIAAATCIQKYARRYIARSQYFQYRRKVLNVQKIWRGFIARKRFYLLRSAALTIQAAYRLKKKRDLIQQQRTAAATCIQKYARRYIVRSRYLQYAQKVKYVQRIWRGKLITRLIHCEFLQKRRFIIKLQSIIRGHLVRKQIQAKKAEIKNIKEEQRQHWAASKIQALCRGHIARVNIAHDKRVAELRRRWRNGGLESSQESMKERNEEAMEVLRTISCIETVIKVFRSLELLTEVFPMMYNDNASAIVHRVYTYMFATNRSISSIEMLKSAAAVLVNLTRYRVTGPKIYLRDRISPILKFMWRFSNSETQLFCIMATYLWLFSKYESVKSDLTELLNLPENQRMLVTIKGNIDRNKRMATNSTRSKFHTPQPSRFVSLTNNHSLNMSASSTGNNIVLPALEPDYGIVRVDKPRYFEDAQQAINCLFYTYKL